MQNCWNTKKNCSCRPANNPIKPNSMQKQELVENVMYQLAKASDGQSPRLFQFFSLDAGEYESVFPLTKLQKNVLIDSLINGGESIYNVAQWVAFNGPLDVALYKEALYKVVNQEPFMRTVFVEKDALMYQAVRKTAQPVFDLYDISGEDHTDEEVMEAIGRKTAVSYGDLFGKDLSRHFAIKVSDNNYYLIFSAHQVMHDARSAKVFYEKVFIIYHQLQQQEEGTAGQSASFSRYIFYNNEHFDGESSLTFWKQWLYNTGPLLPVPGHHSPSAGYAIRRLPIRDDQYVAISKFCADRNIHMAAYFKVLFGVLLNYYLQPKQAFTFLENMHGRAKTDYNTIGLFFHPVPVKIPVELLTSPVTISDFMTSCVALWQETEPHQEISYEAINTFKRQQGLIPIFNYINQGTIRTAFGNLATGSVENAGNRNEIQLLVEKVRNQFSLKLFYHNSLFTEYHFLEQLLYLSDQFLQGPSSLMSDLEYCLPAEKEMIQGFYRADPTTPYAVPFNRLFEERAALFPDRIAVAGEDTRWTYRELNEKAGLLATHLFNSYGITQGKIVGVWMERSPYTLVTILAIFKLGGIYLPLDTHLPEEKWQYIYKEAAPGALIISSDMIKKVSGIEKNVFVVDLQLKHLSGQPACPAAGHDGSAIAYLLYTSGSTGAPKGVLIPHQGMVNHLFEKVKELGLTDQSIVAQNANAGFDISVWQYLAVLLTGGCVMIYPDDTIQDVDSFAHQLGEDRVTILEVVPSYLSMLLDLAGRKEGLPFQHLSWVIVTGEVLQANLVNSWYRHFPGIPLMNAYGPTEASDDITHATLPSHCGHTRIPIGKPIANIKLYIVDEAQKLCAIGIPGEIQVSGICVGAGYLNDAARTQAAFGEDIFDTTGHRPLYKTGDMGAWLPDGNVLFYGRKDAQVKIHGNRLELGEVEHQLLETAEIYEAVVLDKTDESGNKYLAAYIRTAPDLDLNHLRKTLSRKLQAYMIPSSFVLINQWPLLANGKVDRQALYDLPEEDFKALFVPAATKLQEQLCAIWCEVLAKASIGIKTNFFDLGGQSLKAMQVVSRVYETLQVKIDLKVLFAHPTVEELAESIEAMRQLELNGSAGHIQELYI